MKNNKQLLIIIGISIAVILIIALVVVFVQNNKKTSSETPLESTTTANEGNQDAEENGASKEKPDIEADLRDSPEDQDQPVVATLDDLKAEIHDASWSWVDKLGFLANVVENEQLEAIACWLPPDGGETFDTYNIEAIKALSDDESLHNSLRYLWQEFAELEGLEAWLMIVEEAGGDVTSIDVDVTEHEAFFEESAKLLLKHRAVGHPDDPDGVCIYDPEYLDYSLEITM